MMFQLVCFAEREVELCIAHGIGCGHVIAAPHRTVGCQQERACKGIVRVAVGVHCQVEIALDLFVLAELNLSPGVVVEKLGHFLFQGIEHVHLGFRYP